MGTRPELLADPARRHEHRARALHDLRGPLTVIRGQCFTLLRDEPRPEHRRRLALIEGEVDRLAHALDVLLGEGPAARDARPAPVELSALVARLAERHQGAAHRAGVRLEARLAGPPVGSPVCVPGDPDLIRRALDNLVQNALRHAPRGGAVRLTLAVRTGHAHVRVRDGGPGVHPDDRELIFDAGRRGRDARGAGHGLGLAIARQIAEAHGGRLELEPLGPGASFRLSLPLGGVAPPGRGSGEAA